MNCCSRPRMRLVGFNKDGSMYRCDNCGKEDPELEPYEPELGQAVFGNPTSEFDFDKMPDHWVVEEMIRLIAYRASGCEGDTAFSNSVFEINPYYWGDDETLAAKPNFLHKPSGLEIRWYKHIGRGMSSNRHVCPQRFWNVFAECMNSLEE